MKKNSLTLFKGLFLIISLILFTNESYLSIFWVKITVHFAGCILLLILLLKFFWINIVLNEYLNSRKKNYLATLFSVIFLLIILETVFSVIPRSNSVNYTLASKNWFGYYWKTNEMGYRDIQYSQKNTAKKKIFFLGDSFTAGHGIKKPKNRFSNLIGEEIKSDWECFNLGVNGADTKKEIQSLIEHPYKPNILIWQYYGNDIEGAALKPNTTFQGFSPYYDVNSIIRNAVKSSFLLNYLYWNFPHSDMNEYQKFLEQAYGSKEVLNDHFNDIDDILSFSATHNCDIIVVVFPFLKDIPRSKLYTTPIITYLEDKKIKVVDVSKLVDKIPPRERVVNKNDGHPSELVHLIVANEILKILNLAAY